MSSVNITPVRPRSGAPSSMNVPSVVSCPCTYCGGLAMLRCEVCMSWYCSAHCQTSHWPKHRRDCVQPPALLWSDGSKYEGEKVVQCVVEVEEQNMTRMTTLLPIGNARLEQEVTSIGDNAMAGKKEKVVETDIGPKSKVSSSIKPLLSTSTEKVESVTTRAKLQDNMPGQILDVAVGSITASDPATMEQLPKPKQTKSVDKNVETKLVPLVEPTVKVISSPSAASARKVSTVAPTVIKKAAKKEEESLPKSKDVNNVNVVDKNTAIKKEVASSPRSKVATNVVDKNIAIKKEKSPLKLKDGDNEADKKVSSPKSKDCTNIANMGAVHKKEANLSNSNAGTNVKMSEKKDSEVKESKQRLESENTATVGDVHSKINENEIAKDSDLKSGGKAAGTSTTVTHPVKEASKDIVVTAVPEVKALTKEAGSTSYTPAILSTTLPVQTPPTTLVQVVLPVDDVTSPGQFGVRLLEQESQLNTLLEKMNTLPPPIVDGWKVGRRETLAVMEDNIWYRGLAVRKMGEKFQVYLLDYGGMVEVSLTQMRPLPADCGTLPAASFQVCLAGLGPIETEWGEQDGELLKEILNSSLDYKLGVEFVGQVEGGRWAVKLRGIEDQEDVGQLLLVSELARQREDVFQSERNEKDQCDKQLSNQSSIQSDSATAKQSTASTPPSFKKVSRGSLTLNSEVPAVVCFLESPKVFYICPISNLEMFSTVLTSTQDCPAGPVVIKVGSCCLVQDEDCWFRAEIVKLGKDDKLVQLFLLDSGKIVDSSVDVLKPLPDELVDVPGLVCKVNLIGIKSNGKAWSSDEIGGAEIVLDVGKDTTQFVVKVEEVDVDGQYFVSVKDAEANDVAKLMIDTGIAVNDKLVNEPLEYKVGCLSLGTGNVIILNAVSPMELYVCSMDMFMQLSNSMAMLEEEAANCAAPTSAKLGDVVLVCDEGTWYRGKVYDVKEDQVTVELVDIGTKSTVRLADLRVGSSAITKEVVNAVSCCLDSWIGEDKTLAMKKWGSKMGDIVEPYSEMEIEVVEQCGNGQFRIKVPDIEKKLKSNEVKRKS